MNDSLDPQWAEVLAGPNFFAKSRSRSGPDFDNMTDDQIIEQLKTIGMVQGAVFMDKEGRRRLILHVGRTVKPYSQEPDRLAGFYVQTLIVETKKITRVKPSNAVTMELLKQANEETILAAKKWLDFNRSQNPVVLD